MNISTRIFRTDDNYELAIRKLVLLGVPDREINVLMPDLHGESARTSESKDAWFFVRGVGRVIATGDRAKALLKSVAARREGNAGPAEVTEPSVEGGLPLDDFFVFEDALRTHEKVVFVSAPERHQWEKIDAALDECGGKVVHQAREEWWTEFCKREERAVATGDAPHDVDDYVFRLGFEVALHPSRRGMTFEDAREGFRETHPEACDVESFRRGYTRGEAHQEALDSATAGAADCG